MRRCVQHSSPLQRNGNIWERVLLRCVLLRNCSIRLEHADVCSGRCVPSTIRVVSGGPRAPT